MEKISFLHAVIMGLVQGLTEFLPISSSGHLVLAKFLLGAENSIDTSAFFEILLHVGTLAAVCIVYFKDVISLIVEFFKLIGDGFMYITTKKPIAMYKERRIFLLIVVASIPTAILGILMQKYLQDFFMSSVTAVGCALLYTAVLMFVSVKIPAGHKRVKRMTFRDAVVVGIFQGIATTPGISRSGSTIVGGLLCGLDREFAIRFSFLISLPAIAGASLLSLFDVTAADIAMNGAAYLGGMLVAAVSGYLCIRWLLRILRNNKFHYFGYYCAIVGVISIIAGLV